MFDFELQLLAYLAFMDEDLKQTAISLVNHFTVEPLYNEVLGTMKITLLYQVSHYIRVKKQRNIKSWDQQNYLVIRGFSYIRPRYNEVPLYFILHHITYTDSVQGYAAQIFFLKYKHY